MTSLPPHPPSSADPDEAEVSDGGDRAPLLPPRVRLVLYPGETRDTAGVVRGHLYVHVDDRLVAAHPAAAGPPPGAAHAGEGGHIAEPTRAGAYILGFPERHTSVRWPASVVPWGARLRSGDDGEIEYSSDGGFRWLVATGREGLVVRAVLDFLERTRIDEAAAERRRTGRAVRPVPIGDADRGWAMNRARSFFVDELGRLRPTYDRNDFGPWAFNLWHEGRPSEYYVHTTPDNEAATAAGRAFLLAQSHGCIHIRPVDRAAAMAAGHLQQGVRMEIMPYGLTGPRPQT